VHGLKAYTAAVTACAAAGQWAHAVQLLQAYAEAREVHITVESNNSKHRQVAFALMQHLRAHGCHIVFDLASYYAAIVAMRASCEVHKADAVYKRLLTSGLVQPWSTAEVSTLDVSRLYITAVAEAAIRTVLHDMCNRTSVAAAAAAAQEVDNSSDEHYYVHNSGRDLCVVTRQQQCSNTTDTTDNTDNHADSSDGESDTDNHGSSMLQLCVTELLEQLGIVFTVDDTNSRVTVPVANLQQYVARTVGAATG
jgi:hypothetical protein